MAEILSPSSDVDPTRGARSYLTVTLPPPLREAVEQLAAASDRSMSSVVREALRQHLSPERGNGRA